MRLLHYHYDYIEVDYIVQYVLKMSKLTRVLNTQSNILTWSLSHSFCLSCYHSISFLSLSQTHILSILQTFRTFTDNSHIKCPIRVFWRVLTNSRDSPLFFSYHFLLVAAGRTTLDPNQFISFKGKDNKTVIFGCGTMRTADALVLRLIKSRTVL